MQNGASKPIVFCERLPECISPYIHLNIPTSQLEVSWNRGTPRSSTWMGFPVETIHLGVPHLWKPYGNPKVFATECGSETGPNARLRLLHTGHDTLQLLILWAQLFLALDGMFHTPATVLRIPHWWKPPQKKKCHCYIPKKNHQKCRKVICLNLQLDFLVRHPFLGCCITMVRHKNSRPRKIEVGLEHHRDVAAPAKDGKMAGQTLKTSFQKYQYESSKYENLQSQKIIRFMMKETCWLVVSTLWKTYY